jgi:glycerophosphoryl diester phosphodiesterase
MQPQVEVVAHRGASAYAAEHTVTAYDLALEQGADALELDIRATRDGQLVVLHDRTLARTHLDRRAIGAVPAAELPGPLPPLLLEEVIERYAPRTRLLIELKEPTCAMERELLTLLDAHETPHGTTIQSFDACSLRRLRSAWPDLQVAPLIHEDATEPHVLARIAAATHYACGVGVHHTRVTPAVAAAARANGLRLRAFTVNQPAEMKRLIDLGVDGLITDVPGIARTVAARRGRVAVAA